MVAVAMSGGVDSSVAIFLLLKKGYNVFGLTMRLGEFSEPAIQNAKGVCRKLEVKHYVVDFEKEFKKRIINPFCRSYFQGVTPNPCVWCNEKIKFGLLLRAAGKLGADYLATGHYARLRREIPNSKCQVPNKFKIINSKNQTIYRLLKAKDKTRDQSYFLYRLKQSQLRKIIFPLGNLTKNEVKKIAMENGLIVGKQRESREICFVPDNNYQSFLKKCDSRKLKPGPIKDLRGNVLGEHRGLALYTIGQRKGLVGGRGKPFYVVKIDKKNNAVIVGQEKILPSRRNFWSEGLFQRRFIVKNINLLNKRKIKKGGKIMVKVRSQHPGVLARISGWIFSTKELKIKFKIPQRALAPGQSAVFYSGNEVLGGGIIKKSKNIIL